MRTSTAAGLRARLEALEARELNPATPRPTAADMAAYDRLRAALGAEFGVDGAKVFRATDCPVLAWLGRICDGIASQDENETFRRVTAVCHFDVHPFSTADYLNAVCRAYRSV